ncbi:PIN domain-containing protein [Lachnoclostridium sp. An14]|uniref:PIN domain-containing protein n=1 Tax=Lachnoclostridium sp. An14 TaxID=1965562 RepID=UPI000B36A3B1|nr:PIN domain-containing protein [Lachnoclostridium sp. An14]OUQ15886.1 PIN domain-containing protein [Lachnoclostridium sp. An14]
MKIMCDTNVILDVLLEREPFVEDSCKLLRLCEEHRVDGFVSASSVTDIFYLVRKHTHSIDLAYKAVGKLLEIVKVCSVTNDDVLTAFQRRAKDFEDCLVATCAKSIHCESIITRNKKDFEEFGILLLTPTEFLQQFS